MGCVRWSAWKPTEAFKTPVRYYARLWWDRERALVAGDAYLERWARCDCNLGGRVVSSGLAVWITPRWVVVSTTCMGGPCGPTLGARTDPLIMATDFMGRMMRLLRERPEMVVGLLGDCWSGVWGVGFVWGVCNCEVGVVRETHQGGDEGVGCVGRVILSDCEG